MAKVIDFNEVQADAVLIETTSFQSFGYGIVSQYVMKNKNISISAKGVYGYLVSCAGNDKQTYPNQTTMCKDLGIKKVDTLRKYIKELQAEGFIKVIKTTKKSLFYKNVYLVADDVRSQEAWKAEYLEGKEVEEIEILDSAIKNIDHGLVADDKDIDKCKDDSKTVDLKEEPKNEDELIEEMAIKNLRENTLNFDLKNENTKSILIKNEIMKIKERMRLSNKGDLNYEYR